MKRNGGIGSGSGISGGWRISEKRGGSNENRQRKRRHQRNNNGIK